MTSGKHCLHWRTWRNGKQII